MSHINVNKVLLQEIETQNSAHEGQLGALVPHVPNIVKSITAFLSSLDERTNKQIVWLNINFESKRRAMFDDSYRLDIAIQFKFLLKNSHRFTMCMKPSIISKDETTYEVIFTYTPYYLSWDCSLNSGDLNSVRTHKQYDHMDTKTFLKYAVDF